MALNVLAAIALKAAYISRSRIAKLCSPLLEPGYAGMRLQQAGRFPPELPHADAFHSGLEVCLSFVKRITMPSDDEILFHRSFLGLEMALSIWNDYYYARGERDRQRRCESDPVYAYHVRQGPHYPAKPPGDNPDKRYSALLCRSDGSLAPLAIITKRGMTGQNFPLVATQWERTNSMLCGPFKFYPVVNAMMEVTAHFANVWDSQLIRPAGLTGPNGRITPEECIANEIPLYLWIKPIYIGDSFENQNWENLTAPEGWESFERPLEAITGGIDVLVMPNGKVIGAKSRPFQRNNGTTYAVMSPLDFWTPGSGLLAAGIRTLTNRITAAALRGLDAIVAATAKDLTLLSAKEFALSAGFSRTLPGVAVSARSMTYAVEHVAGRTFILGQDMAKVRASMATIPTEAGVYDLLIHGTPETFKVLIKMEPNGLPVWRNLSVREVADAIRTKLPPGVQLRLLSCDAGLEGQGVAQELANELNRTVWGADGIVWTKQESEGLRKVFIPDWGKLPDGTKIRGAFHEFRPQRGSAALKGTGGKVTTDEASGEINRIHPRPPGPGR
jgi:hypothetical protein